MDALTGDFIKHQIMAYYKMLCRGDVLSASTRHHVGYLKTLMENENDDEFDDYITVAEQILSA